MNADNEDKENKFEYEPNDLSSIFITSNQPSDTSAFTTSTIPKTTKGLTKSARNRHYAQTSRARHRLYVSNLEKDRQLLLDRLDKLEEENLRMRREIEVIKARDDSVNNSNIKYPMYDTDVYKPTTATASTFSLDSQQLYSQYALSVLDLSVLPKKSKFKTNSPRPTLNLTVQNELSKFLVDFENGWRNQMNWKSKLLGVNCQKKMKKKNWNRNKYAGLIRLIKLAKLKIYLQLFGNNTNKSLNL